MTELPKLERILVDQAKQILNLMIAILEQHRPEDYDQETLTTLIGSAEHVAKDLELLRTVNYQTSRKER
jgi:hypothetical protein